jgi:hypothetical protein
MTLRTKIAIAVLLGVVTAVALSTLEQPDTESVTLILVDFHSSIVLEAQVHTPALAALEDVYAKVVSSIGLLTTDE